MSKYKDVLESDRLFFRHFNINDAQDVYEYSIDEETVKYLTWSTHKNIDQTIESINSFLSGDSVYAIVLKDIEKVIGCFDFRIVDEDVATFGYVLNRKYWNKGYMSETLSTFIKYLFNELDIKEIYAMHEKGNIASGKVMKKCGMKWTHFAKDETVNNKTADYDYYRIKKATI